jgi:hypothetical protein
MLEGLDVLRPAVRVAGIIHGIDANKEIPGPQHLGPAQRQRQEHRVARRHIGDGYALARLLRDGDGGIRQCRAADLVQVEPDDLVIGHTGGLRDTHRAPDSRMTALGIVGYQQEQSGKRIHRNSER